MKVNANTNKITLTALIRFYSSNPCSIVALVDTSTESTHDRAHLVPYCIIILLRTVKIYTCVYTHALHHHWPGL